MRTGVLLQGTLFLLLVNPSFVSAPPTCTDQTYKPTTNENYCIGVGDLKSVGSHLYKEASTSVLNGLKVFEYCTGQSEIGKRYISTIEVFGIEVDGKPLRGWFHVQLTVRIFYRSGGDCDPGVDYRPRSFVMFGADDKDWNYGEFVPDFPQCSEPQDYKDKQDFPKWAYLPCAGASKVEQSLPWGVMFIETTKNNYKYGHLIPPPQASTNTRLYHFTFRLPTTPCNQPKSFYIKAVVYTACKEDLKGSWRIAPAKSDLIELKEDEYIGAPDPIPRTYQKINCRKELTEKNFPYIKSFRGGGLEYSRTDACPNSIGDFKGRCDAKEVHTCRNDIQTQISLLKYSEYMDKMTEKTKKACKPCEKMPPRPKTTIPPPATPAPSNKKSSKSVKREKKGITFYHVPALGIWDARIIHGIAMTIVSIFLVPVNIFFTRYFKETFMQKRIFQHRLWFFYHHLLTAFTLVFYAIGLTRIMRLRSILGVSMSDIGSSHRNCGWFSVIATILMTFFGGFRCMNRICRAIGISAHWTVGMAIHIANYVEVILSVWIAGSPSAFDDVTRKKGKFEYFALLCGLWIFADICFHLAMTVLGVMTDKKLKLTKHRNYLPSLIPVLREHSTFDLPGSKIRKRILAAYLSLSILFTFVLCVMIITQDPKGRGLGQMSCTHSPSGSILPPGTKTTCSR